MNKQEFLQSGIGRKIIFIGRAADMISISLSPTSECPYVFVIHIMTDGEIFLDGKLLTNTKEIFEFVHPDVTKYDSKIADLQSSEKAFYLQKISYDNQNCLHAEFSDGLELHSCFSELDAQTDDELWRVFLHWKAEAHLIATGQGVMLEECEETQEELDRQRAILHEAREKRRKNATHN